MKVKTEYQNFVDLTDRLLAVSHSEIKAKLDAKKKAKRRKPKKGIHMRTAPMRMEIGHSRSRR